MSIVQKTFRLAQIGASRLSSTHSSPSAKYVPKNVPEGYTKIRAKMEKFQVEDGVPVYLKGGVFDKILYQLTVVLCIVGLGQSGYLMYELSYPPSNEN